MSDILNYPLLRIAGTTITPGSLAAGLAILAGSWLLAKLVQRFIAARFLPHRLTVGVRYALGRFAGYLILVLGFTIALETLGIHATALAAFGAALGVGIGFGLQDIAKNFLSGLILLVERPIEVGDRVDLGSVNGQVVEIRTRATVIRTNDDVHLIVPNSRFISDMVTNRSHGSSSVRYSIPVVVAHGSDPREVEAALLEAAGRCEGVLTEPPAAARFANIGDNSLEFRLLCWTSKMLHRPGALRSEINFAVHDALRAHGIEPPPPPFAPPGQLYRPAPGADQTF